jgi:nicotinamidase-related amidase
MKEALIIIDIQNDYFKNGANPLTDSDKAGLNAKRILEHFRFNKSDVIHVQHISLRQGSTFFLPDTNGCEIHDHVKPISPEKIIQRHFPNSFRETELLDYLKNRNIIDLVFCGMMTHMCVDSTVRAAKDLGFNCTVIGDACATKDLKISGRLVKAQEVHNGFLAALSYFYSKVMTTEEYLKN